MAATKYNYTFGKGEVVSTFVAAFYDAVLLYALALNDTLRDAENPRGPLDGAAVIRKMWNRTFQGKAVLTYLSLKCFIFDNGCARWDYPSAKMTKFHTKFYSLLYP